MFLTTKIKVKLTSALNINRISWKIIECLSFLLETHDVEMERCRLFIVDCSFDFCLWVYCKYIEVFQKFFNSKNICNFLKVLAT